MDEYQVNQALIDYKTFYSEAARTPKIDYFTEFMLRNFTDEKIILVEQIKETLFYKQYNLMKELEKVAGTPSDIKNNKKIFRMYLVNFYRFIIQKYSEETNNRLFRKIFEIILSTKSIYKIIDNEYFPVFYNRNEKPPLNDKFCIVTNANLLKNTYSQNNKFRYFDLTNIEDNLKNDLKEFLWYSKGNFPVKLNHWESLMNFIMQKIDFDKDVSLLNRDGHKEFSELFLYYYREFIESKYSEPATIKAILKIIRSFLNFHYEKYNLTEFHYIPLSLKGLEVSKGGKVISEKDLKILYDGFRNYEMDYEYGRLFTIVFELFILTRLRVGEILNLERVCLEYNQEDAEYVQLSYYSKKSNKEKINHRIHVSIAMLIEEAKKITSDYVKNSNLQKYIFVHPYNRVVSNECCVLQAKSLEDCNEKFRTLPAHICIDIID